MGELDLVDSIYECAFVPELWPDVLDRLAVIGGGVGGVLIAADAGNVLNFTSSSVLSETVASFASTGLLGKTHRQARIMGGRYSGFITERLTEEELAQDPLYRDLLYPKGLGWAAGTAFTTPTGDTLYISMERVRTAGRADAATLGQLDLLRPHITRSAFLAARQHLARARAAADTLALIGLPTIVMDRTGKVLAANDLATSLDDHLIWRASERFALKDRTADAILRRAIASLYVRDGAPTRSFVVRREGRSALVAHLLPLRGSARDLFERCMAVLVMTPVAMPKAPPVELVQSLFDLTPSEARVARNLAAGKSVEEIATEGGVSKDTIRSHLKGVLGKTGCRRQAEVAALLGGVSLIETPATTA